MERKTYPVRIALKAVGCRLRRAGAVISQPSL